MLICGLLGYYQHYDRDLQASRQACKLGLAYPDDIQISGCGWARSKRLECSMGD